MDEIIWYEEAGNPDIDGLIKYFQDRNTPEFRQQFYGEWELTSDEFQEKETKISGENSTKL